jgi:regulator of sirC expression with transglutaminase-like and TPR domain
VMDLLIDVSPGIADHYKQRGLLYLQMKQMRAARADLQRYLQMSPEAPDRAEMEKQLLSVVRWMATLN